jgi:hypothetical protein
VGVMAVGVHGVGRGGMVMAVLVGAAGVTE